MKTNELNKYIYILSRMKNLGNVRIKSIISHLKTFNDFLVAKKSDFHRIEGIEDKISEMLILERRNIDKYEKEFLSLQEKNSHNNIEIINIFDENYPANLKKTYDAPVILFIKGNLDETDNFSLSIVGTRNPTDYGKKICEKFTNEISELRIPIISGLAKGIDTIAHTTALKNSNITYAILGCGIDVIYPAENKKLYSKISESGALISEFVIGTAPDKQNFPKRNRIISGISVGTIIIETGIKGGSLITAGFALDQNKEVFAVPGHLYSKFSAGTNELIKKGQAKLITNIDDILSELNYKFKSFLKANNLKKTDNLEETHLNVFERKIFDILNSEPIHIDKINSLTGLSISDCLVNLLSLEFKELVKQIPGKYFLKI